MSKSIMSQSMSDHESKHVQEVDHESKHVQEVDHESKHIRCQNFLRSAVVDCILYML